MSKVRVRFAPSPTGPLHIGGLRTALFNYLFAKKHGGTFILRIEDTDQARFVPGAEEYILESLRWCGIGPDEGIGAVKEGGAVSGEQENGHGSVGSEAGRNAAPESGGQAAGDRSDGGTEDGNDRAASAGEQGPYGPYRQSERKALYGDFADQLLGAGKAYYAFDTPEELEQVRKEYEGRGETFTYDMSTRMKMRNSLTLMASETVKMIGEGVPHVIRFKFNEGPAIVMQDLIRGEVQVEPATLDDKVLFKSDGMPTYHLANVVDDHEMKITHVIRGEEWLPSLPLHVSLYKALGWETEMPQFAHLPLILKPDGKGKLSKRDGDKGGFPVFPLEWTDPRTGEVSPGYREEGYFPEACVNILAFLGWNPGTEQELYSLEELVKDFDLEKVGRSGARFDPDKAKWFNHQYLQQRPVEELARLFMAMLEERGVQPDKKRVERIVDLTRERTVFVADLWEHAGFFFEAPDSYNEGAVKKRWKEDSPVLMRALSEVLATIEPFDAATLEERVKEEIGARGWNMGAVMNAWRLLLVGDLKGPSLFETAEILGKEEVLRRIERGISELG
jgi:glutamyl-tRNA synthetase